MELVVLGAGMQGRVIAANLAARDNVSRVTLADARPIDARGLDAKVAPRVFDALDARALRDAVADASCVISVLPGSIGHRALPLLIDAGVPVLDVAFTPESPLVHHDAAVAAGVPVVVDCGVAPGLSHVLAADAHRRLGGLDALTILVGGMPLAPPPVFHHAVYFNARDLLDEYIRPARLRRGGKTVGPAPLDEPVLALKDADVGDLEAFASDGLRTLLDSFPDVPDMVELTLRVPGHLQAMRDLRALGFLDGDAATDAAAAKLGTRFAGDRHPDRLLMEVWGRRGDDQVSFRLHAQGDAAGSAMARTTGFTAAAAALQLARGAFKEPGVHPPERLGADGDVVAALLHDLLARGVGVQETSRLTQAAGH